MTHTTCPLPTMMTPPAVARQLGVKAEKILTWIRSGELVAVDVSAHHGVGRPRWRISETDLEAFLLRRSATPPPKPARRRRADPAVTQYF